MPDIDLRFGRDMLVLSAPLDATLARQGIDAPRDRQYLNLMEPDAIVDAFRLEAMAGAQCLVTTTEDITRARLWLTTFGRSIHSSRNRAPMRRHQIWRYSGATCSRRV